MWHRRRTSFKLPVRRSIRVPRFDYSTAGAYFITICVNEKRTLLGDVVEGKMVLTKAGEMVQRIWYELPMYHPEMDLDAFQVMPNHIHGIIILHAKSLHPISKIIQTFKRYTTIEYIKLVKSGMAPPFNRRFWQRNYYEHIIRDEEDLTRLREYILNNPAKWTEDHYHPSNV